MFLCESIQHHKSIQRVQLMSVGFYHLKFFVSKKINLIIDTILFFFVHLLSSLIKHWSHAFSNEIKSKFLTLGFNNSCWTWLISFFSMKDIEFWINFFAVDIWFCCLSCLVLLTIIYFTEWFELEQFFKFIY